MLVAEGSVLKTDDFVISATAITKTAQSHGEGISVQMLSLVNEQGGFKSAEQIEHELMMRILEYHQGNITKASKDIGMAKSTFYKKLDKINRLARKE